MFKAYVIQPVVKGKVLESEESYLLQEAVNLTKALSSIKVVESNIVKISELNPATFFGSGKVEDIKNIVEEKEIDTLVINEDLTPAQQSNLEKILNIKVADRKGVIIAIFAKRARTKEGKLQAELASLIYQKTRIVKAWSHLERQRGGGGFTGGPGEKQKEIDRRLIEDKIAKVKLQLVKVKKTRALQRENRKKTPYKTVSLVGYTNAGKSTLFNSITNENIFAKDLLFATLDPTTRSLKLPYGQSAVIVDTVGFISNLPHELIMSFRATLEEVESSDIVLHVIDCSNKNYIKQIEDVKDVLKQIGLTDYEQKVIEVYNKTDLLSAKELELIEMRLKNSNQGYVFCSAISKQGVYNVRQKVIDTLSKENIIVKAICSVNDLNTIQQIYKTSQVISYKEEDNKVEIVFSSSSKKILQLSKKILNLKLEYLN